VTANSSESSAATATAPARSGLVLITLILVAAIANLNLAVANVALPDIGKAFDASQTALNLVAVGYSLGLAASVLYLGAMGDRYGRKLMLVLGTSLAIPAALLAFAPSVEAEDLTGEPEEMNSSKRDDVGAPASH
jgi:MFS transporter, DHA2 family, multidrug resistance protein